MRVAILSDIHGNLEALTTALELIKERAIEKMFCLGDTVGYGASPNECLDLVKANAEAILLGNHDEAALNLSLTENFNPFARVAAEWTSRRLTDEHKELIKSFPYTYHSDGMLFVHSSPYQPREWHYILSAADALTNFPSFSEPICFVGHSHVPGVFCEDIWSREVTAGKKCIVNVGSIGQPRDYDPRLSFGIFDTVEWKFELVRAEYDVETAAGKIRKEGLPRSLADRLLEGR